MIEDGYHNDNPYHNALHAADVCQAMHCYMKEPLLAKHRKHFGFAGRVLEYKESWYEIYLQF